MAEGLNVCVIGYGTVGKNVVEIIEKLSDINVKYILMKKGSQLTKETMITDYETVLQDESVKVILEMINGDAYEYIVAALKAKKSVISSNKLTICKHLKEYVYLANLNEVSLFFDASVCGGIPIISNIDKYKRSEKITSLKGIMNGTSNFILDLMTNDGFNFDRALKKAKELGYAESDPSADILGYDVLRKIVIASEVAYDLNIDYHKVFTWGINNLKKGYLDFLKEYDYTLKLIGYSKALDDLLDIYVMPVAVKNSDLLSKVNRNLNIACLSTETIGTLAFIGQGAGGKATANQMVNDLLDIKEKKQFKIKVDRRAKINEAERANYFIFNNQSLFESVMAKRLGDVIVTKKITLKELRYYSNKAENLFFARIEE